MIPAAEADEGHDAAAPVERIRHWVELILYGSITLQALMLGAAFEGVVTTPRSVIGLIWASGLGLLLAHAIADGLSHRIVYAGARPLGFYARRIRDQYVILIPSAAATMGVLLAERFNDQVSYWYLGADAALVLLCSAVAYSGAQRNGAPLSRRIAFAVIVGAFTGTVALVTLALKH